ncbi:MULTISPECIES: Hpt domain-containing protein [Acinetobacter]|uniref:histidine kinase n=1 Tax=Acinetobacter genomosp. 15BJ TaxID=106651 RepID=A0ABT8UUX6_9GAMM|nr:MULTISPECIES: Hpt domain-containing protein [Acinetobacter]MCI3879956.1 Hpt domain-containing protein [Acinetobacter higginsii]MDO3656844.1 Hpt domain-containing protein [Acinetobacter genomosp. 15BJ]
MKQILKTLVETMTLPEDSYLEQDAEILEIFIEELDEIFVELEPLLVQWAEQPHQQNVLSDIRRHFHTLKGSGRMVGAKSSGELAWTVEDTLNRVIAGTISLNADIQRYVQTVFNIYRFKLCHDFKAVQQHLIDFRPLVVLGQQLQQQQSPEPALAELLHLATDLTSEEQMTGLEQVEDTATADHEQQQLEPVSELEWAAPFEDEALAKETLAIFQEEAEEHLATIDQFLQNDRPSNDHYNTLIRALHTLRGSSAMAHVNHVFEASSKVENLFKTLLQEELDSSSDETALLTHYAQFVRDYLHTLKQQASQQKLDEIYQTFNVAWDSYDFQLEEKNGAAIRPQGLVSELLELNINDLLDVEFDFESRARQEFPHYLQVLSQQTETLLQHTHHHATIGMYQYTSQLRSSYQDLIFKPSLLHLDYAFELYHQVHQQFIQLFDTLAAGQRVTLTKVHERVLNELSSFTQQNVESLDDISVVEGVQADEEAVAPEAHAKVRPVIETADFVSQFALDKQQLQSSEANRDFDPDLVEIFLEEADELLGGIDTDLNTWAADHQNINALKNLMRYLHTLKGGANMIQARHIGLIAHELETLYEKLINQQIQATPQLITAIRSVQDDIADRIQTIRDQQVDYPATHTLAVLEQLSKTTVVAEQLERETVAITAPEQLKTAEMEGGDAEVTITATPHKIESITTTIDVTAFAAQLALDKQQLQSDQANRDFDPDLIEIFLEEADELLVGIDADLNTWTTDHQDINALKNLMRYLHTLKGGSNMIQARHIGLIAHELETIYEKLINQQIQATPQLVAIIRLVQDDIADRIQTIRDQHTDYPSTHVVQLLQHADRSDVASVESGFETAHEFERVESSQVETLLEQPESVKTETLVDEQSVDVESVSERVETEVLEHTASAQLPQTVLEPTDDDVRSLVEQTFLEEAEELLEQAQGLLKQWFEQRGNRSLLLQLQRNAHSLKGGARMAEMDAIAIIAYHLENAFEQFGVHHFNSNVYDNLLNTALAWLNDAISKRQYANFDGLKQSLEKMEFVDVSAQLPQKLSTKDVFTPEFTMEFVQGDGTEPPSMLGEWETTERIEQNNEMIRVSAEVIEKMIDLSGENAINRSRIEMDLGQLGGTLTEMELAIKRLADQLRRMEGELESQIIARHGGEEARYADFDPLEMDQYSSLNQLSKSLAESASDLVDFKTTLSEKIRDTEGLLLQQSRIQAEIQESLMRTRLVPFSRLLPRLQRIVRQTASALNRPTELVVNNTEGELDRSILERLVAPFEHMLRNAIDHGIEDREQRLQAQKPETGHIVLNIGRQGTDVVVTFSDDGKGIDVNRIKEKALQTGLMTKDQKLDQEEILQFIFHPGFSTATQVTQISGRGVGLDVVQSDIKALGGHVSVDSTLGQGTIFTIRVPTTVAVSDALMVKAGDQQFAFPLAQIDRIVRISPLALEQYFESQDDYFTIDQERYRLRYLSEFVAGQPVPRLSGVVHSLPVLLIKGAQGQTTALLVDQLIGSRGQIVVKPVGQQFSNIGVIAGATILGDGQVCLILDGQNIARQAQSTARSKQADETYSKQRYDERRLIMIVDDSVTVRKVTSRLLERQGYDVVTAKDGVDAIEQLETVKPDLMLLDIEMPRMDGFEVSNLVRHHEIHRDLPIIMITSRTGEKHRERALSLGVNQYMGKPFQEEALLENIESLLTVR